MIPNPFRRDPAAEEQAPFVVMLELWPNKLKGRATVTENGRPKMLEISAPYMAFVLQFLRKMGVKL